MKIDKFFRKQAKAPAAQAAQLHDDAQKLDAGGAKQQQIKDLGVPKADQNAITASCGDPADSMDIDQVQKHKQHKVEGALTAGTPLLETTNQQQAAAPATAAGDSVKTGGAAGWSAEAIDLSSNSPQPAKSPSSAAAAAAVAALPDADADGDADAAAEEAAQQGQEEQLMQATEANPVAMDVDSEAPAAAAQAEVAAGDLPATAAAGGTEPATPAVAKLAGTGAATPGSALNTSTAKVPAEAFLTPEQRKQLLEACLQELPLLEAELDVRPDLAAELAAFQQQQAAAGNKAHSLDLKYQVSVLVEGQSMTLMQLAQHISSVLSSGGSSGAEGEASAAEAADAAAAPAAGSSVEGAVAALAARNIIQDVASRKSYGLQDGLLVNVDAMEDATAACHWCWELRTLVGLPKPVKQAADAARKRRKQLLERLKAASAYVRLACSFTKPTKTAEAKLAKAAAKLAKLPGLENAGSAAAAAAATAMAAAALWTVQQASTAKAAGAGFQFDKAAMDAAKEAGKQAERASKAEAKAGKEADAEAKQAEKAARAAAKAAEAEAKARAKAETDEKREEARRQKADEAARKASEAAKKKEEAARKKEAAAAAKKGFHSMHEMHSAQAVFRNFFGMVPRHTPTPAGPSGDTSQGAGSQHEGSAQLQQQQQQGGTKELQRLWAPPTEPPSQQQVSLMLQLEQGLPYFNCSSTGAAAKDVAAGSGGSAAGSSGGAPAVPPVHELLALLVEHWKVARKTRRKMWGAPPSWAQRPGAAADSSFVTNTAVALYGAGVELQRLRCWRRKLIKHHDSVRPPFYGSMSQRSRSVHGRRPLGQDTELDYDVMSDQDWEEEPEGESLSNDGDDDEEPAATEGEEDEEGFVVGDGYLSEDEGMHEEDDDTAAAADSVGACSSADGSSPEQTALAQLEAGLERARQRGRPLALVNSAACPGMSWEPSSNLDPSLLGSLKGSVLCPDLVLAPPTPAQLWHLHPGTAAAAAAAGSAPAGRGAGTDATVAAVAAAAGDVAAAAAGSGTAGGASGRGRPPSAFPEVFLPALVAHIQANSTQPMDKLVASFVEAQAAAGFKLAKLRVKDKIKEVATMKMIAKAPKYTVRPEFLQPAATAAAAGGQDAGAVGSPAAAALAAAATPAAAPAAAALVGAAEGDAMQVDEALAEQQQQLDGLAAFGTTAAAAAPASGVKRPAPADAAAVVPEAAAAGAAGAAAEQSKPEPPAKKQKTPGGRIERFFGKATKQQQHQQQQSAAQEQQVAQQEQQQQQQQGTGQRCETAPSTPRHQQPASPAGLAADDAAAGGAGAADVDAVHSSGGVLPMLTPPSHDIAADRPTVSNSPVPFHMNPATGAEEPQPARATAAAAAERPPVNRWHAQANCRGMGLQGGDAGSMPGGQQPEEQQLQQQQQGSQPFAGFDHHHQQQQQQGPQPEQQQERQQEQQQQSPAGVAAAGPSSAAAAAGAAVLTRAAAAAASGSGCAGAAGTSGGVAASSTSRSFRPASSVREVPRLPADGSAPGYGFWKQLASWIINVREPDEHDIQAAFEVFDQEHLRHCIHSMPQVVLTAMVKTLGSTTQALAMRVACACCIANAAMCMAEQQQPQEQQQQQGPGLAAAPCSPQQQQQQQSPAAAAPGMSSKRGAGATHDSPSPSPSPRSAPVEVSFEELCAEPGLLGNLLACMSPDKVLQAAKDAAPHGGPQPTHAQAAELARNAVRAVAGMLRVGLPTLHAPTPHRTWCPSAGAAAAQLRLQLASVGNWRGALRAASRDAGDRKRSSFALMSLWALASDPPAAEKLTTGTRLPVIMLRAAADCGTRDWVLQKWGLLLASALLSEESIRQRALPQEKILSLPATGDEQVQMLEGLAQLSAAVLRRTPCDLSQPGPDRTFVHKALSLARLLVQVLDRQRELSGGRLSNPRLASILRSGQAANSELVAALEGIALQEEWEEAAERARATLASISSGVAAAAAEANYEAKQLDDEGETSQGAEIEMQDA